MKKSKIFLASMITTATMTLVGCSGGGGSGSSVTGSVASATSSVTSVGGVASYVFNTSTDLRIGGVPFYEARSDASGAVPPSVEIRRATVDGETKIVGNASAGAPSLTR